MDRWCSGLYKVTCYHPNAPGAALTERLEPVPWYEAELLVPGFGAQKVFDIDTPDGLADMASWLRAARFVLGSKNYKTKYVYYTVRGTKRRKTFERLSFDDVKV